MTARPRFFAGNSGPALCVDATPKPSGAIFTCEADTRALPGGSARLSARAVDPSGHARRSETVPVTIGNP